MNIHRPGDKRRLLDALNRRFTGEVPFYELDVADGIVDQVLARPARRKTPPRNLPWLCSRVLEPHDYVEFLKRIGSDAGYLREQWFLARKNKQDEKGRPRYLDGMIKSRADLRMIKPPSLDPAKRCIEEFLDASQGTDLGCVYALDSAPDLAYTAIGPADFLIATLEDPGFVNEFLDRVEDYTLRLAECVLQYPLTALFTTGLICGKTGPLLSPEHHERLLLPRVERMLSVIRPSGVPVILHSDGDNSPFMNWIARVGFAALHPVEPAPPRFDIYDLKTRFGDSLCLCGNIDLTGVLTRGAPADVRADTLDHLRRLSPGGGYICGSSHDISEDVPFENFRALAETVCSFRAPSG